MDCQPFQTVVFDAVGTLIWPDPAVATVYTAVGRRFGSKLTEPEIAGRFRAIFAEVEVRDRAGDLRTNEDVEFSRWQDIVRRVLDDVGDCAGCFAELWQHFARPSSWRVFPEVPAALATLASRGVRLAIASNFDHRLLEIARQIKPLDICQPVLVSSQVGYRKPHQRFFEAIRSALGSEAGRILYVGDDPHNDFAPARAAGFAAVLLNRQGLGGDATIATLTEISSLKS